MVRKGPVDALHVQGHERVVVQEPPVYGARLEALGDVDAVLVLPRLCVVEGLVQHVQLAPREHVRLVPVVPVDAGLVQVAHVVQEHLRVVARVVVHEPLQRQHEVLRAGQAPLGGALDVLVAVVVEEAGVVVGQHGVHDAGEAVHGVDDAVRVGRVGLGELHEGEAQQGARPQVAGGARLVAEPAVGLLVAQHVVGGVADLRDEPRVADAVGQRDHGVEPVGKGLVQHAVLAVAAEPGAVVDVGPKVHEVAPEAVGGEDELVREPAPRLDAAQVEGLEGQRHERLGLCCCCRRRRREAGAENVKGDVRQLHGGQWSAAVRPSSSEVARHDRALATGINTARNQGSIPYQNERDAMLQ